MSHVESMPSDLETLSDCGFRIEALRGILNPSWIQEALTESGLRTQRCRKLPLDFMMYFLVLLCLFRRISYINLLEKVCRSSWAKEGAWADGSAPTSRAVTAARDRLGVEPVIALFRFSADQWRRKHVGKKLAGRRLYALDGVCMKVPDSKDNENHYGKPGAAQGESAFPQLRAVILVDVATHLATAESHGHFHEGEVTLAHELIPKIRPGSLVLMDRNFHSYAIHAALKNRHVDFIARAKPHQLKACTDVRRISAGDDLLTVAVPKRARLRDPSLPKQMTLRRITYRPLRGRTDIVLLTSLLDPETASWDEIASTYHDRWEGESAFDEIKTHLCGCATVNQPVVFRSKTHERVEQEYYAMLIAFNVLCVIKADVATSNKLAPIELSFVATLESVRDAICDVLGKPKTSHTARRQEMRKEIQHSKIRRRHNRAQPRAVRITKSKFPVKQARVA